MEVKFSTESPVPGGPVLSESGTKPELKPRSPTPGHTVQGSSLPWNRVVTLAPATLYPFFSGFFFSQTYPVFQPLHKLSLLLKYFFFHLYPFFSRDAVNHLAVFAPQGKVYLWPSLAVYSLPSP